MIILFKPFSSENNTLSSLILSAERPLSGDMEDSGEICSMVSVVDAYRSHVSVLTILTPQLTRLSDLVDVKDALDLSFSEDLCGS